MKVAVIGAGTMGRGIAQVAVQSGDEVALHDAVPGAGEAAQTAVRKDLSRLVEKGKLDPSAADAALARLHPVNSIEDAVREAALVIEAVPESLELKREVFARVSAGAAPDCVLASNTSSLPVGRIAEVAAGPERVVGMHFFNPVPVMPLLEVVRAERTSDATVAFSVATARRWGKEPIVVKDAPGFATSRLGVLLGLEAMRMLEEGVASAEDLDKAMELGYRHPMGPLRLSDLVGLDVRLAIAEHLHRELGSEAFRPPEILRRLVAEGKLGRKTGEGFHRWD